ncbi:hypothetical protein L211DRAFT_632173 [Terfezia boudieri ATCC MYA-4762]|uniref:Uncharacterized protein n=1 Tax=Terfezia boudieri ATCC MYA-4762 TaxID=1051890 RepID=A0A3N4L8Z3_9PEZI|nr:hypothetical protein L211DRAFT_632173 [Terfezia boudieri ATCC MYA-4762]
MVCRLPSSSLVPRPSREPSSPLTETRSICSYRPPHSFYLGGIICNLVIAPSSSSPGLLVLESECWVNGGDCCHLGKI